MTLEEVLSEVNKLDKESKEIKSDLIKLCWYMRGALTIEDAHYLSYEDRQIIGDLIKDNLETTKKTGMPFF
jgi:hypothetical protein